MKSTLNCQAALSALRTSIFSNFIKSCSDVPAPPTISNLDNSKFKWVNGIVTKLHLNKGKMQRKTILFRKYIQVINRTNISLTTFLIR